MEITSEWKNWPEEKPKQNGFYLVFIESRKKLLKNFYICRFVNEKFHDEAEIYPSFQWRPAGELPERFSFTI